MIYKYLEEEIYVKLWSEIVLGINDSFEKFIIKIFI